MSFTWMPIYKEIAQKVLEYENKQNELIDIISNVMDKIQHRRAGGETVKVITYSKDGIDPFTFFTNFNRGKDEEGYKRLRIEMVGALKGEWRLKEDVPKDLEAIPIVNNFKPLFSHNKDNIKLLWNLFKEGLSAKVQEETFNKAIGIKDNGCVKISMGLFWINPTEYLAVDKHNTKYLKEKYDIDSKGLKDFNQYSSILNAVKEKADEKFYEISYDAYIEQRNKNMTGANKANLQQKINFKETKQINEIPLNLILYGPPGTGKTYKLINEYSSAFQTQGENNNYEFVTFHQSFSYEDFIEGIKPVLSNSNGEDNNSELSYTIEKGVFLRLAEKAKENPNENYAIFIDEINRGNIVNILGELITLIEEDKRKGNENEVSVILPYSKETFSVPKNLYIIATMNTADRSIEAIDSALRRRFTFEECEPEPDLLKQEIEGVVLSKLLKTINKKLLILLDKDHLIGHSFLMKIKSLKELQNTFKKKIIPLLEEYFYNDRRKIGMVLGETFVKSIGAENITFAKGFEDDEDFEDDKIVYNIKDINEIDASGFKSIYKNKINE